MDDFSPLSPKQVLAYFKHKGLKPPRHRKTKKPTTNDEALQEFIRQRADLVLEKVLEARHLNKAISYLDDTYLGRDGRLHPRYTYLPKTGRLSSKAPNIMNIPQGRGHDIMREAAQAIRGAMIPDEGFTLIDVDWKAIEAVLVGFFAQDEDYILAAKKGVHDIFASHLLVREGHLKEPWSARDTDLDSKIEWLKKKHKAVRDRAKKRIHAGSYGQGSYNMAKDLGISVAEVKVLDEVFAQMAPKVAKWQDATRRMAHYEGGLTNPFGYSSNFFEVFRKGKNGEWVLGKEASEALAQNPQSTAAAMLRECLLLLGQQESDWFQLLIPTHDSITAQARTDRVADGVDLMSAAMCRPWPELGGLVVDIEIKTGPSMDQLKPWTP